MDASNTYFLPYIKTTGMFLLRIFLAWWDSKCFISAVTNMSGLLLNLCVLWDIHCYQLMFQIYYEIQKRVLVRVMYQLNFEKSTILTPPMIFFLASNFSMSS